MSQAADLAINGAGPTEIGCLLRKVETRKVETRKVETRKVETRKMETRKYTT